MTKDIDREIIAKYIRKLPHNGPNTRRLFCIGFVGLPGVGKSFIAELLYKELGLYVTNNDDIRRFLNKMGFEGNNPNQLLVQEIAEARTVYLYENKISHIIDADLLCFQETAKEYAHSHGAELFFIEINCPEKLILERLKARTKIVSKNPSRSTSRATGQEYHKRKEVYNTVLKPEFFYSFDSSSRLDCQIEELVSRLRKNGMI